MLVLENPLRKDSFGAGLQERRSTRGVPKSTKVFQCGPRHKRQGQGRGEVGIAKHGAANGRTQAPPGMVGDQAEDVGVGGVSSCRLDDVGLGRETVFEKGGQDPRVRVETQDEEGSPAHHPGQVDPLGDGHLGQPSEKLLVRCPAHRG